MSALPPAGWYPDTTQPGQQRYWDGTAWTAHTAPSHPTAASAASGPQLATFGQRLGAMLLDTLVMGIPVAALIGVAFLTFFAGTASMFGSLDQADPSRGGGFVAGFMGFFLLVMLAGMVVPVLYGVGFEGSRLGQTIGKWAVGIRVVDGPTAGRLTPGRALVRVLVRSLASGNVFALGYLWMLWDEQNRTWHDLVADSRVVVAPGPKPGFGELLRSWTLRS